MTPDIAIGLAGIADADAVTDLLEASFPELTKDAYDPEILRQALPLICRANPALLSSGTYFIATSPDGIAVGCGGWTPEKPGTISVEPGVGHLRHFATRAGWTGRGVGRRIYDRSEAQARAAGITVFEVYAGLNAEGFYRSLGFSTLGGMTYMLDGQAAYPSIWMRRSL